MSSFFIVYFPVPFFLLNPLSGFTRNSCPISSFVFPKGKTSAPKALALPLSQSPIVSKTSGTTSLNKIIYLPVIRTKSNFMRSLNFHVFL